MNLSHNLVIHLVLQVALVLLVSGHQTHPLLGLHLLLLLHLPLDPLSHSQVGHLLLDLLQIGQVHLPVQDLGLLQVPFPAQKGAFDPLGLF